ncbi:MAG: hypothetical protein KAX26_14215 [Anaerolineae bacterium]|nr:hypothetical protein [Anaerolineae bacterium]
MAGSGCLPRRARQRLAATALMSAFLNNVTIMLLMAPITIEIALMLEINPTALIIPEALAAEVGGTATLIGDPPNTVIGSFADLGFNQFLIHMGPIALIATITLMAVIYLIYRYVVDLRFLDKMAAPIVVDVENEVTKRPVLAVDGQRAGCRAECRSRHYLL